MAQAACILVTGATGKVGRRFLEAALADPLLESWRFKALCHNRTLDPAPRLEVAQGSIADRAVVAWVIGDVHAVPPPRATGPGAGRSLEFDRVRIVGRS